MKLKKYLQFRIELALVLFFVVFLAYNYIMAKRAEKLYYNNLKYISDLIEKNITYLIELYPNDLFIKHNLQAIKEQVNGIKAIYVAFDKEEVFYPEEMKYILKKCQNVKKETIFELPEGDLICIPLYEKLATQFVIPTEREGTLGILFKKDLMKEFTKNWLIGNLIISFVLTGIMALILSWIWKKIFRELNNMEFLINRVEILITNDRSINENLKERLNSMISKFSFDEFRDISKLIENLTLKVASLTEEIRNMAILDPLTGLFNRNYLHKFVEDKIVSLYKRRKLPLSVAMIDIDRFKQINDTFGHQTGDKVLKRLAEIIKAELRKEDIPIRFGGEEILIIFPYTQKDKALRAVERIKEKLAKVNFGFGYPVTFSAGIAEYPGDIEELIRLEDLIRIADRRLYIAKRTGRNRIVTEDEEG